MTLAVKVAIGTDINSHYVYPTKEFLKDLEALIRRLSSLSPTDALTMVSIQADLAALILRVVALEEDVAKLKDSYQS